MTAAHAAPRCVVAVMAKEPAPGRTKTRLSPPLSPLAAAQLYEALLNDTIALVSNLHNVRIAVAVTPAPAPGAWRPRAPADAILLAVAGRDIGDCLHQATEQLCAAGFSHVIAVNSDGPTLPAAYIRQADALLEHHDLVLGPSEDGGYYLVGLRQPRADLFRDVEWSSARVLAQTRDRAAALGLSVALLPAWYDVDTPADLERLRFELACLPAGALPWTRRFFAGWGAPIAGREAGELSRGSVGSRQEEHSG